MLIKFKLTYDTGNIILERKVEKTPMKTFLKMIIVSLDSYFSSMRPKMHKHKRQNLKQEIVDLFISHPEKSDLGFLSYAFLSSVSLPEMPLFKGIHIKAILIPL